MKIQKPAPPKPRALTDFDPTLLTEIYRRMVRVRRFEKKVNELFMQGIMPGTIHLSFGQEAVTVGASMALEPQDIVTPTHRGHGHALAKGMTSRALMAELFGKADGCCKGKGGSLHIGDMSLGILPAIAIVAAASPISAGMAFASKRKGTKKVICNYFGDGAINKGDFHEAMNLASVWSLPLVFLCENNLFGVSTHITEVTPNERLSERAAAYRVEGTTVYGNDPLEVYTTVATAAEKARSGKGPTFIEALTYRQGGHKRDDPATYRDQGEVEAWLSQDPVVQFRERCAADSRIGEKTLASIESEIDAEIHDAVDFAQSSPLADVSIAMEDVYA